MSTEPTPWEERLSRLRSDYNGVQDSADMDDVTREVGEIATDIAGLPGMIQELRGRGYAFASYLENKAQVLATQWDEIRQEVRHAVSREIERIQKMLDELRDDWRKLETQPPMPGVRERFASGIESAISELEQAVEGARNRVKGMYGSVPDTVRQTKQQIAEFNRYLDLAEEATVTWKPTEAIFVAVQAEWVETGKGKKDPDGILYLTDQRLIFEQKEKVGGRLGFGGDKVQEVLWETPVGAISEVKAENKGLLGGKDMIHLKLSSGDYADITLEVKGGVQSKWYAQQLNRAITGEINKERAIAVDAEAEEAVKNAPTACSVCGATLPPITRGMTEIACEYCGTVVRL